MLKKLISSTLFFSLILSTAVLCSNAFCASAPVTTSSATPRAFHAGHVQGLFKHHSRSNQPVSLSTSTTPLFSVSGLAKIIQRGLETIIIDKTPGDLILTGNTSTTVDEIVKIFLRSSSDIVLLKDNTGSPTIADGYYYSNGGLFFSNPQGFVFGPNSQVHAANILVSTLNISNSDFLAGAATGKFNFTGQGTYIINEGRLIAKPGGYVALLSGAIKNEGTIQAQLGSIVLASGDGITLTTVALDDNDTIFAVVNNDVAGQIMGPDGKALNNAIENKGIISANGGTITLTAKSLNTIFDNSINNSGIIEAKSLSSTQNGDVVLKAKGAPILNTGTVSSNNLTLAAEQGIYSSGSLIASDNLNLFSQGPIYSLGVLQSSSLIERGSTFQVGGVFSPGDANVKNADGAMEFAINTDVSGSGSQTTDSGDIIIDPGVTLTMTGDTTFTAGDSFLMDPTAIITGTGGGYNLTISAANDVTLGNINNVSSLTATATAGNLTIASPISTNGGNVAFKAGQEIIQESGIDTTDSGAYTNGGNYTATAGLAYILDWASTAVPSPSITSGGSGIVTVTAPTVAELGSGWGFSSNTATTYDLNYIGGSQGYSLIQFGLYFQLSNGTIVHIPSAAVPVGGVITKPTTGTSLTTINIGNVGEYITLYTGNTYTQYGTLDTTYYWYSDPTLNMDTLSHVFVESPSDEATFLSSNSATNTPYSSIQSLITSGGSIYNWADDPEDYNYAGQYFNDDIIESTVTTPNVLIITANNATKVYGAALPPLTANYSYGSSFNVATGPSDMTTGPTVTTTATASSPVVAGGYPITASGAVDSNYSTILYVPGTLTITPATPSFTAFGLFDTNYKVNKIIYETLSPYQLSTNTIQQPLIYFYHPLTPVDQSAFDGIALDQGAYDFIQNSLELKKLPPAYYGAQ